jgi:hypothetical protein
MTVIAVGGLAVYLMDIFLSGNNVSASGFLVFHRGAVLSGEWWRLLTFIFVPPSSGLLTLLVLFFYHWLGRFLEAQWGTLKLNIYYFTGVVLVLISGFISGGTLTASQLNLSLFLAMATIAPEMQIRVMLILPVKMKWLALLYAIIIALDALAARSLLPLVPVGNYLLFFYPDLKKILLRQNPVNVTDFRRAKRRVEHEKGAQAYLRKCAVCGLTDTEDPRMDFRYCSLCTGRKCYCREHLFNHEHN